MAIEYNYKDVSGVITSVVRKTSSQNREFAEVVLGGEEFSIWEPGLMTIAEQLLDQPAHGEARQKQGSRYWSISKLEPGAALPAAPAVEIARVGGIDPDPFNKAEQIRLAALDAAVRALSGRETAESADAVLMMARQFEVYIMGDDLTESISA